MNNEYECRYLFCNTKPEPTIQDVINACTKQIENNYTSIKAMQSASYILGKPLPSKSQTINEN